MTTSLLKKLVGILVFLISLTVYLLTLEPTTSFWDCSEFIVCAYKLEIGHAPGAPVYMLLGRIFSLFAGNNTENVALFINALSALASAFTVFFLFHIIYWFAQKVFHKANRQFQKSHYIILMGSAIGSLVYAFTDSFWFSAVEAEVYATSSMFSAFVFWCITKYEQEPKGWSENRWILLILFLLGLSVGIHLLNLLALPAMALVIYFKKFKSDTKGVIFTISISVLLIIAFIYLIIPGIVKSAAYFDLLFVNYFKLPVYSGALFFIGLLISLILFSNYLFKKQGKTLLHFATVAFSFWLIGYSSFTILVIRSNNNPFVDINNVENIFGLVDYLNREQYPQRPLIYGNNYNSPIIGSEERYTYKLYNNKYFKDELNPKYKFNEKTKSFFPRMASLEARQAKFYEQWVDIKGKKVKVKDANGVEKTITTPTFFDNVKFFIRYQVGHMYMRYFMWNFAGKQNDTQGYGDKYNGNWISGIPFIDNLLIGNPIKNNSDKSCNKYYLLPLLFGLAGMLFHYKKNKPSFLIAFMLFFITGPAIIIYLNEVPITPRERDYVHVGSFMVFAIWIGIGASWIAYKASIFFKSKTFRITTPLILLLLPVLLISENWDNHDRSDRYLARDFAKNMLSSCEQNAILFTTADNDTYPLWYLQEVETFRTDIRQILTTFLPVDWYGNQLNQNNKNSGKVPISFKNEELLMEDNHYFPIVQRIDSSIEVKDLIQFIKSEDKRTKVASINGEELNFIPGKKLTLEVNYDNFKKQNSYVSNTINPNITQINFDIKTNHLTRDELLILDILANNNWERSIYTVYPSLFESIGLSDYLHREGMVYRFLPFKNINAFPEKEEFIDRQYKLLTNTFVWGNVNNPNVFLDHTCKQMVQSFRLRQMFADVGKELIKLKQNEKAENLIDLAIQILPGNIISFDYFSCDLADIYYAAGAIEKANSLVIQIENQAIEKLDLYTNTLKTNNKLTIDQQLQFYLLQQLILITENKNQELNHSLRNNFEKYSIKLLAKSR